MDRLLAQIIRVHFGSQASRLRRGRSMNNPDLGLRSKLPAGAVASAPNAPAFYCRVHSTFGTMR
jgi:hypothetical protein